MVVKKYMNTYWPCEYIFTKKNVSLTLDALCNQLK